MAWFDAALFTGLYWLAQALTVWAFVDAGIRPSGGFVAAGKLTKPVWAAVTALGGHPRAGRPGHPLAGHDELPRAARDHRGRGLPGRRPPGRARSPARQQ